MSWKKKQNQEPDPKLIEEITNLFLKVDEETCFFQDFLKKQYKLKTVEFPEEIVEIILSYIPLNVKEMKLVCRFFCKHYLNSQISLHKEKFEKLKFPLYVEYGYQSMMEEWTQDNISFLKITSNTLTNSLRKYKNDGFSKLKCPYKFSQVNNHILEIIDHLKEIDSKNTSSEYANLLKNLCKEKVFCFVNVFERIKKDYFFSNLDQSIIIKVERHRYTFGI